MNEQRQQPLARPDRGPAAAEREALADDLRALPDLEAPERIWRRIRAQADLAHRHRDGDRARRRFMPLALAASVVLAAATVVFVGFVPDPDTASGSDDPSEDEIAALMERSRQVEARRRTLPALPVPSDVEYILKARIGDIDASLNRQLLTESADAKARKELLRQRVDLMESLVHVEQVRRREIVHQAVF